MKILSKEKCDLVAGGGTPQLVCSPQLTSHAETGNVSVSTSSQTCKDSSGTTTTTSINTTITSLDLGVSGLARRLMGLNIEGERVETTTTTTSCDAKNQCNTTSSKTVDGKTVSDLSDGSDAQNLAFDRLGDDLGNFDAFAGGGDYGDYGGGSGGGGGCVQIASFLPGGAVAGDVTVGSTMQLSDQVSLEAGTGVVSFSKLKKAQGYRLTTASGITLVCSNTAPIPTPDGIVLAPDLAGKMVAVRRDEGGDSHSGWEAVKSVEPVGEIDVQHITVGDRCFWAGERQNGFILHHNMKIADGNQSYSEELDWDGLV